MKGHLKAFSLGGEQGPHRPSVLLAGLCPEKWKEEVRDTASRGCSHPDSRAQVAQVDSWVVGVGCFGVASVLGPPSRDVPHLDSWYSLGLDFSVT